ncbi:major facilitator superfamily domain-containing protein [Lentinula aff. lateritia]|uniref:Major facilitator superfamily domain-containing protein n=1 Tax=Lentinula aff. lateritia TaxID=2804960 RepID=A0ACC1U673_9AGAR|nr:major facilitator superfamily domain-containing protein [Lentinula aff. lateritia]
MTGGGFAVLDTGSTSNDANHFSGVSYIRGPSWLHMPALTIGLLGISIVWSVEMAYASPYLLSLGLSKSAMAVVFVAGPLSGLVMQPVIGILTDSNTSKWGRRRPYMIIGTILCVFAMSLLGWTKEVAGIFTSEIGLTLWLAVLSVYLIDFSVNAVMAVDRALLVDVLPSTLQPSGNAWAARMGGFGSVVGYFAGNLDLPSLLPIFGHTELQILSVVVSIILLGSHIIMASSVSERVLLKNNASGAGGPLAKSFTTEVRNMFENLWSLPRVIRQIFLIQFFAWISWFPVLFYSTLYIGDLYKRTFFATAILVPPPEISEDSLAALDTEATRIGSRALFYSSLLALFMNIVLPFFTTEASSSSRRRKEERLNNTGFPKVLKIHLVSLWAVSLGVLASCMIATFFTSSVAGGTTLITITGFSWAITQWAPFALLGEAILTEPASSVHEAVGIRLVDTRSRDEGNDGDDESETIFVAGESSDSDSDNDSGRAQKGQFEREKRRKTLLRLGEAGSSSVNVAPAVTNYREDDEDEGEEDEAMDEHSGGGLSAKAGIILGIHNIFVVVPQFLVTGLSAIIFALVDPAKSVLHGSHPGGTLGPALNHTTPGGAIPRYMVRDDTEDELEMIQELQASATSNSVVYIFRVGGVSALIAFVLCWRLARELRHR